MSFGIFPLLNLFLYFQIIPSLAVGCLLTLSGLGLDRKTEESFDRSEQNLVFQQSAENRSFGFQRINQELSFAKKWAKEFQEFLFQKRIGRRKRNLFSDSNSQNDKVVSMPTGCHAKDVSHLTSY